MWLQKQKSDIYNSRSGSAHFTQHSKSVHVCERERRNVTGKSTLPLVWRELFIQQQRYCNAKTPETELERISDRFTYSDDNSHWKKKYKDEKSKQTRFTK